MAQEIEIEYKNLLTEDEYKRLLRELNFPEKAVLQENYYFETTDFQLKQKQSALRIRKKNGNYVLTLKEPHPEGLLETHDMLTIEEADSWFNGKPVVKEHTGKQLEKLGISMDELHLFGSLHTERREITYQNVLLVLDYSQYHHTSDYELELEAKSQSEGIAVFKTLLSAYQIPSRDTPNKIERFFQSIKKNTQ